jgi:hypothetical protein
MAAITSNGTGGGNYSAGGSWVGGVAPTIVDTVTIAAGDTITVDTTGLGAKTLQLNGIITWAAGATTGITFGDATSDTIITFGAGGYWRAGTVATPLTGNHTVTFNPLSSSLTSVYNNFNMAACNTVTSGFSVVCDRTVYGVAESYTHPTTGTVYNTRRNFTQLASQVNTAQALAVLAEDLKLKAGGGDVVAFPGSHATNNSTQNAGQLRTTASYNSGTKTLTATSNFSTQIALNQLAGVSSSGARCYSETSVFAMVGATSSKYWGYTGASSANAIFELQNATLKEFTGNANTFTQLNNRVIQGCLLIGTGAVVSHGASFRSASGTIQWVSCVIDAFPNQNFGPQFYYNCFFCSVRRAGYDYLNVMGTGAEFYDCVFQDVVQAIANTTGVSFVRSGATNCSSFSAGGVAIDCWAVACNNVGSDKNIRCVYGRNNNITLGVSKPTFFELCQILGTIGSIYSEVNTRNSSMRYGFAAGWINPSGGSSPSSIGIKCAPGGNTLGYTTPPDAISAPPSGSTIYNRLVTTAAIAPTVVGELFRPAIHEYQFNANSGTAYSFTVPLLSVSGFTATSLTTIRLVLTWANGASVTTTVSSLSANTWTFVNVSGTAPVSGSCTIQVYVQANIGSLYIDYPLDCDPSGYRWSNGVPQMAQTRLADSPAGTVALAVWASVPGSSSSGTRGALQDNLLQEDVFLGAMS